MVSTFPGDRAAVIRYHRPQTNVSWLQPFLEKPTRLSCFDAECQLAADWTELTQDVTLADNPWI